MTRRLVFVGLCPMHVPSAADAEASDAWGPAPALLAELSHWLLAEVGVLGQIRRNRGPDIANIFYRHVNTKDHRT